MAVSSASLRLPLQGLTAKAAARSTLDEKSAGSARARLFQRDLFEDPQKAARPAASTLRPQEAARSLETSRPQMAVQSESWAALATSWDALKKLIEVILELSKLRKQIHDFIMGLWK